MEEGVTGCDQRVDEILKFLMTVFMNEEALRVLEQRENLVAHFINSHVSNLLKFPKIFFKIYYSTLNQISLNDMSINPI